MAGMQLEVYHDLMLEIASQVADNEIQYLYDMASQRITIPNWQRNENAYTNRTC